MNPKNIRLLVQSLVMVWGLVLLTPLAAGAQQEVSDDGPGAVRWLPLAAAK